MHHANNPPEKNANLQYEKSEAILFRHRICHFAAHFRNNIILQKMYELRFNCKINRRYGIRISRNLRKTPYT